jgi:hypothetical protein
VPNEEDAVHDLDRVRLETADLEYAEEAELDELATQLLEVVDERELDEFLGRLISRAAGAARQFARSDTGRALTNIAKDAARQALPVIGRGVGGLISPQAARGGETMGRGLGQALGLELDGMSPQDQQFEVARGYVRWLQTAARTSGRLANRLPPELAVRRAATAAARTYAPGLVPIIGGSGSGRTHGRWERRGDAIVLYGT